MQNDSYEFRILLFFRNIKDDNLYDTFSFTTLENKPITIKDEANKVIKVKLNKANNRGGIYYERSIETFRRFVREKLHIWWFFGM